MPRCFAYSIIAGSAGRLEGAVTAIFFSVLACLFASFVVYGIRIAVHLKKIGNADLRNALKVMACVLLAIKPVAKGVLG